jgi:hypothetical protein
VAGFPDFSEAPPSSSDPAMLAPTAVVVVVVLEWLLGTTVGVIIGVVTEPPEAGFLDPLFLGLREVSEEFSVPFVEEDFPWRPFPDRGVLTGVDSEAVGVGGRDRERRNPALPKMVIKRKIKKLGNSKIFSAFFRS